ncbi:hypothetical protein EJ357_16025 [Streptomyces cyaneochromogenes]|uniref:ATP-binding protein n=1 Tax=Streptomyces cyaneochromogenes TaxID=2496836 RepID=A0A3S9M6E0_9ACTN|nr:hypothetical protein [Streptomyces cyaneochromogenes]AZQ34806.1 hypothetical protein EJ357_16025 [Streptomyces cyaneochromogenes]
MAGPLRYDEQLQKLITAAGRPTSAELRDEIARHLTSGELPAPESSINEWIAGRVPRPVNKRKHHDFLSALARIARQRHGERLWIPSVSQWAGMAEEARQARLRKPEEIAGPAALPSPPPVSWRSWLDDIEGCEAWLFVTAGAEERAAILKEQARDAVSRLAERYEEARGLLTDDPWHDPHLAGRMVRWSNFLLYQLRGHQQGALAPAEAALLALLPFLHQVHSAQTVAGLSQVDPTYLAELSRGGPQRQAYERFLRGHKRLIRQAMRGGELPDRRDGSREIGWWLFHQWAKRQPGDLPALLRAVDGDGAGIGNVLNPRLLSRLLSCARVTPRRLYGEGPEGALKDKPFSLDFDGRDWQQVRERLVGPLFAIAHALAIEVTDLSSTVVRHVGIPEPLTPGRLFTTVRDASWTVQRDVLGLEAGCHHPAAVAALSEQVRLVDGLLRGARGTRTAEEIGTLPVYAHADEVREVDERGEPRQAGGEVIRFRLDEERIQELLMGENLYRDRSLAIRELYQNALDACRYRRARERERHGRDTYIGEITFTQGYDKDERRHYLECADNGIGMDETVLADVFSRAGVRFTDLPRFQEEHEQWEEHGITIHPNSRFGIGVLSYFMLADEIRVTTRPDGRNEELTVLITGPGHYFKVSRTSSSGHVGTKVRLYLRDGDKAPSCVRELRRLLGLAEFRTVATHGNQEAKWQPGVLRPQEALVGRSDGFVAHGRTVCWPPDGYGADGQVVWCEHGGGVLIDGIYAEPRVRRGVLTDPGGLGRLRGAVVNLTGRTRPRDLSVDRTEILDEDVCEKVEELIRAALPVLFAADPPLLDVDWLSGVAGHSPRLADIVTDAAAAERFVLDLHGHPAPVATAGFFPPDVLVVHRADSGIEEDTASVGETPAGRVGSRLDDVTLLWRLLAHRPNAELSVLTQIVPELSRVEGVLAARPSDALLRTVISGRWNHRHCIDPEGNVGELAHPGHALSAATACGVSYEEVVSRMEQLCLPTPRQSGHAVVADQTGVALLGEELGDNGSGDWIEAEEPVPPGHLLKAHLLLNIGIDEAAARMRALGFKASEEAIPAETLDERALPLLSRDLDGVPPWLDLAEPVSVGHVLQAVMSLGLSFPEVVGLLQAYGYRPDLGSLDERSADELLRQSAEWGWGGELGRLSVGMPVPPDLVARAALSADVPLCDVARRIEELGLSTGALPERAEQKDPVILHTGVTWQGDGPEVLLHSLVQAAEESKLPLAAVAVRLREYGLHAPNIEHPEHASPGDGQVLRSVYYSLPFGEGFVPDRPVPAREVIRTAEYRRVSPQAIIDCLNRYGLRTSLAEAPTKASTHDTDLIRPGLSHGESAGHWLDWDKPVPVYHLVSVPPALLMEQDEVIERLTAFGLQLPARGLDDLDGTDRRLCLEEFEQGEDSIRLPLSLGNPISDFLRIVRFAGLPLDDLLPRLTRLGVDLPRVTDAVRTALPKVPGLVMAAEETAPRNEPPDPAT